MSRFSFETYPGRTLDVFYFTNVANAANIVASLKNGSQMAFLNPSFVLDPFLLLVAGVQVLAHQTASTLVTNNIHSELVYRSRLPTSFLTEAVD